MKAIILASGLLMVGNLWAASITGNISIRLTISPVCQISIPNNATTGLPQVTCGTEGAMQAKVTQRVLLHGTVNKQERRLVTVEW
nr:hypothetical protein [Pantoea sp. 201603H]